VCASISLFNGDLREYTLRRMIAAPLDGSRCGQCADWKIQTNLHVSVVYLDGVQLSGYLSHETPIISCSGVGRVAQPVF
jgi:hypothetical protein